MKHGTLNRFEWLKAVMQAEGLTATAKNVATALAVQFANAETGQINPSQETVANYLKVHRDTIKRVMRELRNAGWLAATGDGGRGKAPLLRLLTPGKIIPFRAHKGGVICPAQAKERGDDLQQKAGQIIPSHNKDEQSLEQKTRRQSDRFKKHQFEGNRFTGPCLLIKEKDWHQLNSWADWLSDRGLPKLCQMPLAEESGKVTVIAVPYRDPRLTNAEQWYVVADPATIDGLEFSYLEGAPGPQIETRQGFEVDGVQMKVRLDFGCGWIDHRGWYRNG